MSTKTFYLNCRNQGAVMTIEEVDKLRSDWFEMWPEMQLYVNPEVDCEVDDDYFDKKKSKKKKIKEEFEESEELATISDVLEIAEKKKIKLYRTQNVVGMWKVKGSAQAVLNFNFQSLAAVISKRALWLVFMDSLEFGYKLVNFIHE